LPQARITGIFPFLSASFTGWKGADSFKPIWAISGLLGSFPMHRRTTAFQSRLTMSLLLFFGLTVYPPTACSHDVRGTGMGIRRRFVTVNLLDRGKMVGEDDCMAKRTIDFHACQDKRRACQEFFPYSPSNECICVLEKTIPRFWLEFAFCGQKTNPFLGCDHVISTS